MAYTGFSYRIAYRRYLLKQADQGRGERLESHDKLFGRLLGCPLIVQTETSASNAINGQFTVPPGEIWLLYSLSLQVSGGTVPHPMIVSIDDTRRVADTGDIPCHQFDTVSVGADYKYLQPTSVGSENDGPFQVNLYPVIIREYELVKFDAGAEAE